MMKKIFTLCLAAVMLLSLLAGCGGNNGGKTPDAPDPAVPDASVNPPEPAAPSGDPVYIDANASELTGSVRFYTAFAGENGTDALIQEFNSYYPNVTVEYEVYKNNSDGNVAADTSMMAGNVDVILSYGVKNTANRWSNDLLMDITDRLAADNLDLVKEWGSDRAGRLRQHRGLRRFRLQPERLLDLCRAPEQGLQHFLQGGRLRRL